MSEFNQYGYWFIHYLSSRLYKALGFHDEFWKPRLEHSFATALFSFFWVYFWWHSGMKWNDVFTSQSSLRLVRWMPLSFDVNTCNFLSIFFAGVRTADGKLNLPSAVLTPAKKISNLGRNSNRPWENWPRKYQNRISSVLSVKKWIMKQSLNSVFSCYHKLSNLVSD